MAKKGGKAPMTPAAAKRIQSAVDRRGGDQAFKARAMSAATKTSGGTNPAPAPQSGSGNPKGS